MQLFSQNTLLLNRSQQAGFWAMWWLKLHLIIIAEILAAGLSSKKKLKEWIIHAGLAPRHIIVQGFLDDYSQIQYHRPVLVSRGWLVRLLAFCVRGGWLARLRPVHDSMQGWLEG